MKRFESPVRHACSGIVWTARKVVQTRELTLLVVILVIMAVMAQLTPFFFTGANFRAMTIGLAPTAIIVVGMTILLVSGGFDLSVGAVLALSGTAVALLMVNGVPPVAALVATLILGAAIGLGNGVVVTKLGVNPLVATLGAMSVARGIALVLTEGFSISNLPSGFGYVGSEDFLGRLRGLPGRPLHRFDHGGDCGRG